MAIPHSEVGSCAPILRVRHEFPLRATPSRAPLSHVAVFLCLRVRRVHPPPRSMRVPGEGTPLHVLLKHIGDNLRGFPSSCVCLFVHATVYGELRRSFTPSHSRVASALVRALITDALVLASVCVKTLADRDGISELYHLSGTTVSPTACMILCVRFVYLVHRERPDSAIDATLDTDGWLDLIRQGLAPCKAHQASPGALTLQISRQDPPSLKARSLTYLETS